MKRWLKTVASVMLVLVLVCSLSATVFAAGRLIEDRLVVGEDESLPWSDVPYVSSDPSVIEIRCDGHSDYDAVAVGPGTAKVTGGVYNGKVRDDYLFKVHRTSFGKHVADMSIGGKIGLTISVLILLAILAGCVYIYFEAPKLGMSRLWAIMPLLSYGLGLLAFIKVRSRRKALARERKVICPNCGGRHPEKTAFCSICGTKLQDDLL